MKIIVVMHATIVMFCVSNVWSGALHVDPILIACDTMRELCAACFALRVAQHLYCTEIVMDLQWCSVFFVEPALCAGTMRNFVFCVAISLLVLCSAIASAILQFRVLCCNFCCMCCELLMSAILCCARF